MTTVTKIHADLNAIATEINSLYKTAEKAYGRTAELLWTAKGQFINGGFDLKGKTPEQAFLDWAMEKTKYSDKHVKNFIQVYATFGEKISEKIEKGMNFSTLIELSKTKVTPKTRQKIVRRFEKAPEGKKPKLKDVKVLIKEDTPRLAPPPPKFLPDFAVRAERRGAFVAKPAYLFGIHDDTPAETIIILAKYWKQKYHPDKGGDEDIFNRILEAEKALLKERGVSK